MSALNLQFLENLEHTEPSDAARRLAVGSLLHAERAARVAGEETGRWWRDLAERAGQAMTDPALDSLFRDALATMRQALGSDTMSVLIANAAGDTLVTRVSVGLDEEVSTHLAIAAGAGLAGRVLSEGRSRIVDDLSKVELASPLLHDSGAQSLVAVPIISAERRLGVLHAASFSRRAFGSEDAELLEFFAQHLAGAMDRVRLFEAERAARERAELATLRLGRLFDAAGRLAKAATPGEVAAALVGVVAEESSTPELVWAGCWSRRGSDLELIGAAGPLPDGWELVALDVDGPLARALRDGQPGGQAAPDEAGLDASGRIALAVTPIEIGQDGLGAMAVCWPTRAPGDPAEIAMARTACREGAQAILRLRLQLEEQEQARIARFLGEAARVLAEASNLQDTLERLARVALGVLGDLCLIDVLGDDRRIERMVSLHRQPAAQALADPLRQRYAPIAEGRHPAAEAIRTGNTQWSPTLDEQFLRLITRDEEHFRLTKSLGYRSMVTVPLLDRQDAIGAVTLVSTTGTFSCDDVSLAERLAEQAAAVVANAARHETTRRTAHVLQESLLPHLPQGIDGVALQCRYLAATRDLEVGGDFYDVYRLPSGLVGFVIGDVEGHDRDAAMMMGRVRSATRVLLAHTTGPADLIDALRQSWGALEIDRMVTAVFGTLDPTTGELRLSSAGHPPPLWLPAGGVPSFAAVPVTLPLGMSSAPAVERTGLLALGDLLLLYTDGAIESRVRPLDAGMALLAATLSHHPVDAAQACDRVVDLLGDERSDDVALLALQLVR